MATPLLTIFGATGYTGSLCAREAVAAGLRLRLAGRRQDALARLAADLGGDVETAVADAADPASLRALADTTDVLLTSVGPYERLGRPVLHAAIEGGAHYLDLSGEVLFVDWAHDQGVRAAGAGVALCPAFGVDGAAGELLAAVAAADLGGPVREVRIGYLIRGGRLSAGSARSALVVAERGGVALVGGRLVSEPALAATWTLPFPPPLGRLPGVSVPLPDVAMVGRSLGATDARAYAAVPRLPGATRAAALAAGLAGLTARTPLWGLLRAGAARLPDGPSPERRSRARCAVVAEVAGPTGAAAAWLRLTDLYGTTARLAVAAARRLLAGEAEPGARTPSQVVADPGAFLEETGAAWERLPV